MRSGKTAGQALEALLVADPGRDVRQVAMVDALGNAAVHTGQRCIAAAGHRKGRGYSVQANLMLNDRVWGAMADTFEQTRGDLAERMMAALEAAQNVGGDIRGKQSAAILIVPPHPSGKPWLDRMVDLRVEDSPDPLPELRRLLKLHRAYQHMNNGDLAVEHGDVEGALREYGAAEQLFPENLEMKFWHATALVNAGKVEESLPLFREVFRNDTNWVTLVPRLPASGTLAADERTIARILSVAPAR
jgi:uncharacterized Ntn-hydrolase superfamily protein